MIIIIITTVMEFFCDLKSNQRSIGHIPLEEIG